jgi:hypothetical protein
METGDHFKNGVSPKSHTSRGNISRKMLTIAMLMVFCLGMASATKLAATQQQQQTPKANSLIGKSIESPEFKALKLEFISMQGLRDEGSRRQSYNVWAYCKNGKPNDGTARYFLVDDSSIILDELIWDKKPGIWFNNIEIYDSATKETEEHFIRYKSANGKCIILSYYENRDGKFIEKKPVATWSVGPDTNF